jgi:flagellar biosynthesis/type III secretory pathway protein FliH
LEGRDAEEWQALQAQGGPEEQAMRAVKLTWAEKLIEQGREQGLERGREQGLEKGLDLFRQTLLRQLALRFGPLPEEVKRRVAVISSAEVLSQMAEQILIAHSLEEMGLL